MTAGGGVGVLGVLADRIDSLERMSPSVPAEVERARKAHEAIAELLAADKEFDEARAAWSGEPYYSDDYGVYGSGFDVCEACGNSSGAGLLNNGVTHEPDCEVYRLETATARRASALAALEGNGHG